MGKRRRLRRFIGDFLIFITVLYTVYLSVIMFGRIQSVVLRDSYIKLFICELAMCLVFLILACDIRFRTCASERQPDGRPVIQGGYGR